MGFNSPKLLIGDISAYFGRKPSYITGLDSATVALQSLASYLKGKDFPSGGMAPPVKAFTGEVGSRLPRPISQALSTWAGWTNASPKNAVDEVRAETMSHWVTSQYHRRQYPAVMIGSSNGAAVHLGAALGIPWLPQTLLFCFRHAADPDDARPILEQTKEPARRLLDNNPDLAVYQMHDPNQDRVKVPRVGYFRLKRIRLGEAYKLFLTENLAPGGTIFLLESQNTWLATRVQDRHLFQFGGKGGLTPQEYFQDSPKIRDFLKLNQSNHERWYPPKPDGWFPESEWGFDPTLRYDVEEFARQQNFRVRRIVFDYPQDLSFLVADLYRWWYDQRRLPSNRLFVENFVYLQPWWTLRLGLVPYWSVFNDQTSATRLGNYLDGTKPYDEIYLNLFSNGIRSLGLASIEEWRSLLNRAQKRGQFLGVDQETYPNDLASFVRHYTNLKNLDGRYPIPEPLSLEQLDTFLTQAGEQYPVQWVESETKFDEISNK